MTDAALLVVANQFEHTLLLLDAENGRVAKRVEVGVNGHEVAVSPDGRVAAIPIYGDSALGLPGTDGSSVDLVDIASGKLAGRIDLGKAVRPHNAAFAGDGRLYVTAELADAVQVVDPGRGRVEAEIPTGQPQSHMLVLSPDGRRAYTANVSPGTVSVLDLERRKLLKVISVAERIQRITISPDGQRVFTHDQKSARMMMIDTTSNEVAGMIALPRPAYASAVTPDGRYLVAASPSGAFRAAAGQGQEDWLYVVDLLGGRGSKAAAGSSSGAGSEPNSGMNSGTTSGVSPGAASSANQVVASFKVEGFASEVLIDPSGRKAYVSCVRGGRIAVLNLDSWELEKPFELTPGVDGLAWASPDATVPAREGMRALE